MARGSHGWSQVSGLNHGEDTIYWVRKRWQRNGFYREEYSLALETSKLEMLIIHLNVDVKQEIKGERRSEVNWEIGIDKYTLLILYIK